MSVHKTKTYHSQNFGNHLLTSLLAPVSGNLYLAPLEQAGNFTLRTYHYKYAWSLLVPGGVGSFEFFCGLYRVMRGTGGTGSTIVLITGAPQGSSTQGPSLVNASGTEYQPQATASPIVSLDPEGLYYVGFLWVDTSTAPARATWQVSGVVLPGSADFFYYRGATGGNTALPATDTISTAQLGQIYADFD